MANPRQPRAFGTARRSPYSNNLFPGEYSGREDTLTHQPIPMGGGGSPTDPMNKAHDWSGFEAAFPTPVARSPLAPTIRPTGVGVARPRAQFPGIAARGAAAATSALPTPLPRPSGFSGIISGLNLPAGALGTPSVRGINIDPKYQTPGASPMGVISGGTISQNSQDPNSAKYDPATGQSFPGMTPSAPIAGKPWPGALTPQSAAPSALPPPAQAMNPTMGDLRLSESQSPANPAPGIGAVAGTSKPPSSGSGSVFPGIDTALRAGLVNPAMRMGAAIGSAVRNINPPSIMGYDSRAGATGAEVGTFPGMKVQQPGFLEKAASGLVDAFKPQGKLMGAPAQSQPSPVGGTASADMQKPNAPLQRLNGPSRLRQAFPGMLQF